MKKFGFVGKFAALLVLVSLSFISCIFGPNTGSSENLADYRYGIWEDSLVKGYIEGEEVEIFLNATSGEATVYSAIDIGALMDDQNLSYEDIITLCRKYPAERRIENVEVDDMPEAEYIGEFSYSESNKKLYLSLFDGEDTNCYCVSNIDFSVGLKAVTLLDQIVVPADVLEQYKFSKSQIAASNENALDASRNAALELLRNKMNDLSFLNDSFNNFSMSYDVEKDEFYVLFNGIDYKVDATYAITAIDNRIDEFPYNTYKYDYQLDSMPENFQTPFKKWIEKASPADIKLILGTYPKLRKFFKELNLVSRDESQYMVIPCLEYADDYLAENFIKPETITTGNIRLDVKDVDIFEAVGIYNKQTGKKQFEIQGICNAGGAGKVMIGIQYNQYDTKTFGDVPKWFEITYKNFDVYEHYEYRNVNKLLSDLSEIINIVMAEAM